MPSLREIISAGYSPTPDGRRPDDQPTGKQAFLGGILEGATADLEKFAEGQTREGKLKKEKEKFDLYQSLRDMGYSKEAASKRVSDLDREQDTFFERIFGGEKQTFKPPAIDKHEKAVASARRKAEKEQLDIDKAKQDLKQGRAKFLREQEERADKADTERFKQEKAKKELEEMGQLSGDDLVDLIKDKEVRKKNPNLWKKATKEAERRLAETAGVTREELTTVVETNPTIGEKIIRGLMKLKGSKEKKAPDVSGQGAVSQAGKALNIDIQGLKQKHSGTAVPAGKALVVNLDTGEVGTVSEGFDQNKYARLK